VRQVTERCDRKACALVLAGSPGIAIGPERQGEFQIWSDPVFVLKVKAEAVVGHGLNGSLRKVELRVRVHRIGGESGEVHTDAWVQRLLFCGVVADIIAPEVNAHFERVTTAGDRKIINQTILRNVASLRVQETLAKPTWITRASAEVRECSVGKSQIPREER